MSDLDTIVRLFSGQQHEPELFARLVSAVNTLCRTNAAGFVLRDIPKVVQILEALKDLVSGGNDVFVEPACCVMRTLAKPYNKCTSTDELKLPSTITSLLTALASYLQQGVPLQLQACTAELLAEFSSAYNNRPGALELVPQPAAMSDLQPAQRLYYTHQSMLAHSNIAPAVCAALQTALNAGGCIQRPASSSGAASRPGSGINNSHSDAAAPSLVAALVLALLNFSYSSALCKQLLKAGLLPLMVKLMQMLVPCNDTSSPSKLLTQVIELLWNLLELAPAATYDALASLQRPKTPAATTAAAASNSPDAQEQQQEQQQQCLEHVQPWDTSTLASTAPDPDIWTRQSCCPSAGCSRPETGLADAEQAPQAASALGGAAHGIAAPQTGDVRLQTAIRPVSAATTPSLQDVQQQAWQEQLASNLVEVLGQLLKQQMADTSSKQAKEVRNDTLAVLHHLSSIDSCCAAMAGNSLMHIMLAAATTPELQPTSQHIPAGAVSQDDADHELKLLVWGALGNAAANSCAALAAVAAGGLLRCLLLVVDESDGTSCFAVGRWSPEQLAALRRMAWSVLQQVTPLCRAHFSNCSGVATLVRHIASSCLHGSGLAQQPASQAIGNMQHSCTVAGGGPLKGSGTLSRKNSCSSLQPALQLLQRLVGNDATMATAFADSGAVPVLLQLLQAPVCDAESTRVGVLLVLAEMCEAGGSTCRDQLRQADGVGLLLKECQAATGPDACSPSLLGLSALDCLWRCCLPSSRSRAQLLAVDGMDMLLDVLQSGSKQYRPVVLSLLADLLTDKRSHPFFLEWHSPTAAQAAKAGAAIATNSGSFAPSRALGPASITAAQLLLSIWREQDQALGLTGPDGVLTNLNRPLAGLGAPSKWCVDGTGTAMGYGQLLGERKRHVDKIHAASTPELMMDKVYACFCQLGYEAVSAGLPPADNAALTMIWQYVKFRQGQVWQDIKAEFEAAGITPTQEDGVRITSGIRHSELLASQVAEVQRQLLAGVNQEQLAAERAMYDAMLAQAAADAKARVYEKDSSKLTMRERLAAKARKETMLKHSLANSLTSATAAVPKVTGSPARGSLSGRSTPVSLRDD